MSQSFLLHPLSPHTSFSTSEYYSNTHLSRNIPLFNSLGLKLGLGLRLWLGLQSNQPLTCNGYISLNATTRISYCFYFYILCKYYHANEDGGVLDNIYYSQLLHTNEYGVVLGNHIQDSQREIPLR